MLPEIGISELLVLGVVALIVVGPKDLPVLMRRIGEWVRRLRGMAADFRASFDEMARQSELDELRKEVEALRRGDLGDVSTELKASQAEIDATLAEMDERLKSGELMPYPPMAGHTIGAGSEISRKLAEDGIEAGDDAAPAEPMDAPQEKTASKPRKPRAPKAKKVDIVETAELAPLPVAVPAKRKKAKA